MRSSPVEHLEHRRLLSLVPFGTETTFSPRGTGTAGATDIAVAGDGSYLIASVVNAPVPIGVSPTDFTVMAFRYSATGRRIGKPLVLEKLPTMTAGGVSAAMDDRGDAVVAYTEPGAGNTDPATVHVVRISNHGEVSQPAVVGDPTRIAAYPAVSMDARGDYFVGWIQQYDLATLEESVHIRAFEANGAARGPDIKAAAAKGSRHGGGEGSIEVVGFSSLAIAARPDGSGAVYSFTHEPPEGFDFVRVGRVGVSATIGKLGSISTVAPLVSGAADVAVHGDGSFVISYTLQNTDSYFDIPGGHRLQRFDANARALGDPIDPDTGAKGTARYDQAVAAMPDGGFVTTFFKTFKEITYAYARHYDAEGVSLDAAPIELASHGRKDDSVALMENAGVGADGRGNVVALYEIGPEVVFRYRRLTSDVAAVDKSVLYAFGTKVGNAITVTSDNLRVAVHSDDTDLHFDASQILAVSIAGGGGDDRIVNDTALPATLDGGDGDDTIIGGSAADVIYGRAGADSLLGGLGSDRIYGNGGRDKLFGGGGNDRLYGGASTDSLYGQNGSDALFGEGGDDRLFDDYPAGLDTLHGGAGNDSLVARDGEVDQVFGDGGTDTATADNSDVLTSVETRA